MSAVVPGWRQLAATRIRNHWLLGLVATTTVMAAFMTGYFLLLRHPQFPVTVMPLTGLDSLIGFQPWAILPYATLWLYVSLVPMLIDSRRELLPYLRAITLVGAVGYAAFLFWPTAVPAPDIDWTRHPSVAFLKSIDASGNACPSLHAAYAVLTGLWLDRLLGLMRAPSVLHAFNAGWCLLIVYSALATKQHVALDVEAGVALGLVVAMPNLYLLPARS